MANITIVMGIILLLAIFGPICLFFRVFFIPKLNELFDTADTKYVYMVSVSAKSLDGSKSYSESDLKFITENQFYLIFDVSVKMKGTYKKDEEVSFCIEPLARLALNPINHSGGYTVIASKHPHQESFEFICTLNTAEICKIKLSFNKPELTSGKCTYSKIVTLRFINDKKQKNLENNDTKYYNVAITPIR